MSIKSTFEKHPKPFKAAAAVVALMMIAGLLWFAFALNGNPVSYALVKKNAEAFVAENHPDYAVYSIAYEFKFGRYTAEIVKPGSEDCHFIASFGLDGKRIVDNYEGSIVKGNNTAARLNMRYRELADTVLKSPAYPFKSKIAYGTLVFEDDGEDNAARDFSLPKSILQPDALYDINALAEQGGLITVYVEITEKTPERAAEVLLELDRLLEQGGVPFYAINLVLTAEDGDDYFVDCIHRAEINESGLADRVRDFAAREKEMLS